jgi:HD-like signal output (HDOD) protein
MKVKCPSCFSIYNIPEERLPKEKKISFSCLTCKAPITLDLRSKRNKADAPSVAQALINNSTEYTDSKKSGGVDFKMRILRSMDDLPPMPEIVVKARKVMSDPNSSFKEIGKILETDQALAGRVLKLANSAAYGLSGMVSSIQHAAVVLGQKVLGELITVVGTSKFFGKQLKGYGLQPGDLWRHSLAVAYGSRMIARMKSPKSENDGFSAGLFHDAGKIILDPYVLENKENIEEYMKDGQKIFSDAEKQVLGLDHSEIAAELCRGWNIPKDLAVAIRYHHHPFRTQSDKLSYILYMANSIAIKSGIGASDNGMNGQTDQRAMEFLDLKEEEVTCIMENVIEFVEKTIQEMNNV